MTKATPQVVSLADVLNAVQGLAQRVESVERGGAPLATASARVPTAPAPTRASASASSKVPSDPEYAKRNGWFRSSRTGAAMFYVAGKGRNVCVIAPEYLSAIVESIQSGGLDDVGALPEKYVADSDEFQRSRSR